MELPLVFFTLLSQLAIGLTLLYALRTAGPSVQPEASAKTQWFVFAGILAFSLIVSLTHLFACTTRRAQSVHGLALVGNPDIHPALRTHGRNSISWRHQEIRLVDRCYGVYRTIRAGDGLLAVEFPCHS
jgi:hypothetical protein